MNGIDKITDKISSDSAAEIEEILRQARADAASMREDFEEAAHTAAAEILQQGERDAAEIERRIRSGAELEARKALLAKKQALISDAFERALTALREMDDVSYISFLCRVIAKASESGTEEVIFSPADRARFGKQVVIGANTLLSELGRPANLTLSAETRDLGGGVIVKSGDIEYNCTLETMLRLMRDEAALDVAHVLFPEA